MNTLVYADVDGGGDQRRQHHRQHRAADVDELRRGRRLADRRPLRARELHSNPTALIHGVHQAFLVLGLMTILSSVIFMQLKKDDGAGMSGHDPAHPHAAEHQSGRPGLVAYFIDAVVKAGRCAGGKNGLAHRQGNPLFGFFPGEHAHFGFRREHHALHGNGVRMGRNIVRQDQYRGLATAHEIACHGEHEVGSVWNILVRNLSTVAIVISGRLAVRPDPNSSSTVS